MIFTEISAQEFLNGGYKRTKVMRFVQDFIDAKIPVATVSWRGEYANTYSCQSSLMQATRRLKVPHIKIVTQKGKVFIYNELLIGDKKEVRGAVKKDQ